VLVFLEEGTLLRITEQELLRFDLRPGMDLSAADVVQLKKSGGASETRAKGAEMIGRQMLSKKELTGRLVKKGAEEKDARDAADWLEDLGAVDDAAYAAALARRCAAGGYGRLRCGTSCAGGACRRRCGSRLLPSCRRRRKPWPPLRRRNTGAAATPRP